MKHRWRALLALRNSQTPKLSAVRRRVSLLALALTSVLWQQPQWRALPSPSGESESSQHRRRTSSAGGGPNAHPWFAHAPATKPSPPSPGNITDTPWLRSLKNSCAGRDTTPRSLSHLIATRVSPPLKSRATNALLPGVFSGHEVARKNSGGQEEGDGEADHGWLPLTDLVGSGRSVHCTANLRSSVRVLVGMDATLIKTKFEKLGARAKIRPVGVGMLADLPWSIVIDVPRPARRVLRHPGRRCRQCRSAGRAAQGPPPALDGTPTQPASRPAGHQGQVACAATTSDTGSLREFPKRHPSAAW